VQTDHRKQGNMMRTTKIGMAVLGIALAVSTTQAEDGGTTAAPQQKADHRSERPKAVFADDAYREQGTSRGSATAQSRIDDANFYAGLGRQGDAPLAEVYTPPPPPKPACHYRDVMSDEELDLCKSAARGLQ
jgi:hypothetical protein